MRIMGFLFGVILCCASAGMLYAQSTPTDAQSNPTDTQSTPTDAQQVDEAAILASIETFFDGMRMSDSSMIRPLLAEGAQLFGVGPGRDGVVAARWSEFGGFLAAVGTPKQDVWNEQVGDVVIHTEGALATAWMDFVFYRGGELSHCGVNVIHFVRESTGWKMFSLGDTRKTDCADMATKYPLQPETHIHR